MPNATETIGTAETYTTIQAWENALAADHPHTGECKAEVFAGVSFSDESYDSSNYPHITVQSGAEHDGRAHEVSGVGNARIEGSNMMNIVGAYVRVSWLELKGPGNVNAKAVSTGSASVGTIVRHCIIHNNHANSGTTNYGFYTNAQSGVAKIYRNIVYGFGSSGGRCLYGTAGSAVLNNTFYECNFGESGLHGGLRTGDTDFEIKANASFDNPNVDIRGVAGTLDYNATADGTGDDEGANGIANLTTANQFVSPTTTWADTDLLVKAGADLIDAGTSFSTATYPEIDVAIDKGATRATIDGTWDIGAGELAAVAQTTLTPDPAVISMLGAGLDVTLKFVYNPNSAVIPLVAPNVVVAHTRIYPSPTVIQMIAPNIVLAYTRIYPNPTVTSLVAPNIVIAHTRMYPNPAVISMVVLNVVTGFTLEPDPAVISLVASDVVVAYTRMYPDSTAIPLVVPDVTTGFTLKPDSTVISLVVPNIAIAYTRVYPDPAIISMGILNVSIMLGFLARSKLSSSYAGVTPLLGALVR